MASTNEKIVLNVYNTKGEVVGTHELDPRLFGVALKEGVVHLAVLAQHANARKVVASTKTKGEVRGGGKKPWKQKGTGRARHGSIRSPLWRGGGVVFGPRADRNFSLKINKKAKRKALTMVLSDKVSQGNVILVDAFTLSTPKTKEAFQVFNKLPIRSLDDKKQGRVALVLSADMKEARRSARNIPFVEILGAQNLNVVDLLQAKKVVFPLASVQEMTKTLLKEAA